MKNVIISGIQPTGSMHIGNYLGAVKNWVDMQADPGLERFYFIPDLHSLTVDFDPAQKQKMVRNLVRDLLALGIDPTKSNLFVQSHVPEHSELCWIFLTLTPLAELDKMTQFKDKAARHAENINAGLYTYPVLMAADILLYKPHQIPVGEDQVQHVELARVIAKKFNNKFSVLFPEPQALLTQTPRVMSLAEPTKKMSKSHGDKSCIYLTDDSDSIHDKMRKAVTDEVGVQNLLGLAQLFDANGTHQKLSAEFAAGTLKNVDLKDTLADLIANYFADFRARREEITDARITEVLEMGRAAASARAQKTMSEVRGALGLI